MLPEGKSIFLDNLVFILNEESYQDCITWSDDGNAFKIINPSKFTDKILPKFFKHKNFSSFHRQLNLYGFTRDKKNKQEKTFSNPHFSKTQQELEKIKKKTQMSEPVSENKEVTESKNESTEDSMCLELRKTLKNKNRYIEGKLEFIEKALVGIEQIQGRFIKECQNSNDGIEKAHQILIYFAEWLKTNPSYLEFFRMTEVNRQCRKNSDVEEIEDYQWPEKIIYDDIIQF